MIRKKFALIFILFLQFGISCRQNPNDFGLCSVFLSLAVDEIGVNEAWLNLTATTGQTADSIILQRNGLTIKTLFYSTLDTILYDDSLLPNTTYQYKALLISNNARVDSSCPVSITTMDTTSHNFIWQIDTVGEGNASILRDVVITDQNVVWAVGEFYFRDSTGSIAYPPYNALTWNGVEYQYLRIPTMIFNGTVYNDVPLYSIYDFGGDNIWVSSDAGGISKKNGDSWVMRWVSEHTGLIYEVWGSSVANVFIVGANGSITYTNGSSWNRMESQTLVDLKDVWGNPSGEVIWACGYPGDYSRGVLLRYEDGSWKNVLERSAFAPPRVDTVSGNIGTVWTNSKNDAYVAAGEGIYHIQRNSTGEGKKMSFPSTSLVGFFNRMRGSARNNIFVVGDFGTVAHYNGSSWYLYPELIRPGGMRLNSVSVKSNTVVIVGSINDRAVVIRGEK